MPMVTREPCAHLGPNLKQHSLMLQFPLAPEPPGEVDSMSLVDS